MNIEIVTYLIYLTISIALTIWVAHTLHKNAASSWSTSFTGTSRWQIRLITCWCGASISLISALSV